MRSREEVLRSFNLCFNSSSGCGSCDYLHVTNCKATLFKDVSNFIKEENNNLELAHNKGMEEAWELARRIALAGKENGYNPNEFNEIFENTSKYAVFEQPICGVLHRIKEWEETKKICVGDVVEKEGKGKGVVIAISKYWHTVLFHDGSIMSFDKCTFIKTGKRIDLDGLFKQIGE